MTGCFGNRVGVLYLLLPWTGCSHSNYSVLGILKEKALPSVTKLQCFCLFSFLLTEDVTVQTKLGEGQNREKSVTVLCSAV